MNTFPAQLSAVLWSWTKTCWLLEGSDSSTLEALGALVFDYMRVKPEGVWLTNDIGLNDGASELQRTIRCPSRNDIASQ